MSPATKNQDEKQKTCFVICPIGEPETEIRHRSDLVLNYIIRPVLNELGYTAIRADEISTPGVITSQIIQHVIDDDLVIADLSGGNPNVYYELAVRHMIKKPVVQIIHVGEKISFDVQVQRTIEFNYQDLASVDECKKRIKEQIEAVEKDPSKVDSPISQAIDLRALIQSGKPEEMSIAQILRTLENISNKINNMTSMISASQVIVPSSAFFSGQVVSDNESQEVNKPRTSFLDSYSKQFKASSKEGRLPWITKP